MHPCVRSADIPVRIERAARTFPSLLFGERDHGGGCTTYAHPLPFFHSDSTVLSTMSPRSNEVSTGSDSARVSPRSGRQHKAWGVSPRYQVPNRIIEPAKRAIDTEPLAVASGSRVQLPPPGKTKSASTKIELLIRLLPQAVLCRSAVARSRGLGLSSQRVPWGVSPRYDATN